MHTGANGTTEIINDDIVVFTQDIVRSSRYFLEITHRIRNEYPKGTIMTLAYHDIDGDYIKTIFNFNLYNYLNKTNKLIKVLYNDQKYDDAFMKGFNQFKNRFGKLNPNSHKTWNGLLQIFKKKCDEEMLDTRTEYSDDEIEKCFFNNGFLSAYHDFEEDNSLLVAQYFSLRNVPKRAFEKYKEPISNLYQFHRPDATTEVIRIEPKVEFIILKESGIIDTLGEYKNTMELAKLIAATINEKFSNFKVKQLCTTENILNILAADSNYPDYINPKSAYKKKNIRKALLQLSKSGIEIEQCKHLYTLRNNSPELFD